MTALTVPEALPLVQFLVGGAQKCGTSALAGYLARHPELTMSRDKETHFFNREGETNWREPDYGPLEAQFTVNELRPAQRGEATPVTLYWTPTHARIHRYNPGMRFILIFRPPVERAWSQWKMVRNRGLEPLGFSEAIRDGRLRVLDDIDSPMGLTRRYSYVERGYYGRQIRSLLGYFPKSQMLFLRQQDLRFDPVGTLGRITSFLEVAPFATISELERNTSDYTPGEAMSEGDRAYLDELFCNDQALFRDLTGIDFQR